MIRKSLLALLLTSAFLGVATAVAPTAQAGTKIVPLSGGAFHTCGITPGGGVQCWGAGGDGTLGNGAYDDHNTPIDVSGLGSGVAAVSAGWYHTCALNMGAAVECWGDNTRGQLGHGSGGRTNTPGLVALGNDVETIVAGGWHSCAVIVGGAVECWGDNSVGQLGDGTTTARDTPVLATGIDDAVAIAAGYLHTCAVLADHSVKCWGDNSYGQLGDGSTIDRHSPTLVPGLSATSVALGEDHACALRTDEGVSCWGDNGFGNLGTGDFESSSSPVPVPALAAGVTQISSHGISTCALRTAHDVLCWGENSRGQIGDGTAVNVRPDPTPVSGLTNAVDIAAGFYHSCALTTGGVVKCWGYNYFGQLGNGANATSSVPVDVLGTFGPSRSLTIDDVRVAEGNAGTTGATFTVSLSTPANNTITVDYATADGTAEAGSDYAGASGTLTFGVGETAKSVRIDVTGDLSYEADETFVIRLTNPLGADVGDASGTATIVNDDAVPAVTVADLTIPEGDVGTSEVGFDISLSEVSGVLFSWGYETDSLSAVQGFDFVATSGSITFLPGETHKRVVVQIIGDTDFESDETFDLRLIGGAPAPSKPVGIATITNDDLLGIQPTAIDAGFGHTCAVTTTGGAKCWGLNQSGQLGSDPPFSELGHGAKDVINLNPAIVAVAAGDHHSCALADSGKLQCWGSNDHGQLGNGVTGVGGFTPVDVRALAPVGVASVAAGESHTCAVLRNGQMACWGSNADGQLGGTSGDYNLPIGVSGLPGPVRSVTAGVGHTCALTFEGGVICWGRNSAGQLGNGTTVGGPTPVAVVGLSSGVIAISAGADHTCALTTRGLIRCWGDNRFGQLGDGSTDAFHTIPGDVSGFARGAVALAAGARHTCAVGVVAEVRCWGDNAFWQIGTRTDALFRTPQLVSGLDDGAVDVTGGENFSCAVMTNDLIKCWGGNRDGQLGQCKLASIPIYCLSSSEPLGVLGWASDLYLHDATVTEGNAGTSAITFRVTLTKPSSRAVTAHYTTVDDDAVAGFDYLASSGTITFAPGETSQLITVPVIGDTVGEPDEHFHVSIGADDVVNGVLQWGVGIGVITNDDLTVTVSIDDISVVEGNTGLSPGTLTVTLSEPSTQTVTVDWETVGASAGDNDYVADEGTVTFAPGATTQTVSIGVRGDSEAEGPEEFWIVLSSPTNARLVKDTGVVRIIDDDGTLVSIHDSSVVEGNTGTTLVSFRVTHSAPSRSTITVDYLTFGEDATSGSDFVFATGTITFAPFDMEEQITIDVIGDTAIEPDERFQVVLMNPVGVSIEEGIGEGTIVNDDVPAISITDASVTEGSTGTTQAALTVSLDAAIPATVTVKYATAESSATAGADFAASSGTLSFAPGETAKEIRVDIKGDALDEVNETFSVDLTQPTNATLADASGIVTITDDDARPTLSVNDVSATEGDAGTRPLVFTVSLSAASGKSIAVNVATVNGTASSTSDYAATSATVTIAAGATTADVSVPIRGDAADENNETFNLSLSSPSNATIGDGTGIGTIVDDDPKPMISYFQPNVVAIGDTVAIRGSGFTGATAVSFVPVGGGMIPATFFQVVNDSKISAIVPPGMTTGRVWVTTPNGIGISSVDLLLQPRITSFSPTAGPPGTIVTIFGSGFFGATGVRFGPMPSQPIGVSDTVMMTVVPQGASTSKIQVFTPAGVATSADKFTVFLIPSP